LKLNTIIARGGPNTKKKTHCHTASTTRSKRSRPVGRQGEWLLSDRWVLTYIYTTNQTKDSMGDPTGTTRSGRD